MKLSHLLRAVILAAVLLPIAGAQTLDGDFLNHENEEPLIFDVSEYDRTWITGDTDNDAAVDYALRLDEYGQKFLEAVDFNRDGKMDDFYFYHDGALKREELDTNYDGRIDLWIFLHRGVYVEAYHRDTDYDGVVDLIKEFGGP